MKFQDPYITAKGEQRGFVDFTELKTLWFNTGTQCNLQCENCYIESSPTNDQLIYLTKDDVAPYLDEIKQHKWNTKNVSFTGGEPFLNPNMLDILELVLERGFDALVLTNAFRVIKRWEKKLLELQSKYKDRLRLRVSLDHYTKEVHEEQRGEGTFLGTLKSLQWLSQNGFNLAIAGRSLIKESMQEAKDGYQKLMLDNNINIDLSSDGMVIFPEMVSGEDVPEITTECWEILKKSPSDIMCANERMIVRRKGAESSVVLPCTLLAYDKQFELGSNLKDAKKRVQLNHEFCAKFCVLGGASCSA